jgi:hypothetical protein
MNHILDFTKECISVASFIPNEVRNSLVQNTESSKMRISVMPDESITLSKSNINFVCINFYYRLWNV